jgi:hypothetical protein
MTIGQNGQECSYLGEKSLNLQDYWGERAERLEPGLRRLRKTICARLRSNAALPRGVCCSLCAQLGQAAVSTFLSWRYTFFMNTRLVVSQTSVTVIIVPGLTVSVT